MTRFWPHGVPISVLMDAKATPLTVLWDGTRHPVDIIERRWRDDLLWWRARIWREYFVLRTHTGLLIMIYHDILSDTWRLQRLYD
jgi:hypothetical protein